MTQETELERDLRIMRRGTALATFVNEGAVDAELRKDAALARLLDAFKDVGSRRLFLSLALFAVSRTDDGSFTVGEVKFDRDEVAHAAKHVMAHAVFEMARPLPPPPCPP